ncbi:RinA family protein [Clostridium perfringens]|uniref:RinA family protein n=1 Tax=Clostridium perfringens TaxID=1502 RepID=UPI001F5976AA|nr:RinA family protein [Clostridium perfringens]MCI2779167.1 RinA family protein [Clostridium perfringens]
MDKELFRKTEAILYDYNNLALKIDLLRLEIKDTEEFYKGCGSIVYEEKTQATNKFNSSVENEILEKENRLTVLRYDLRNKVILKRRIDEAIQNLKDEERKLIELRYINKISLSWKQIAFVLKYSEEYCRKNLRRNAVKSVSDTIFYNSYIQTKIIT